MASGCFMLQIQTCLSCNLWSTHQAIICNRELDILHTRPLLLTLSGSPTAESVQVDAVMGSPSSRYLPLLTMLMPARSKMIQLCHLPASTLPAIVQDTEGGIARSKTFTIRFSIRLAPILTAALDSWIRACGYYLRRRYYRLHTSPDISSCLNLSDHCGWARSNVMHMVLFMYWQAWTLRHRRSIGIPAVSCSYIRRI